MTLREALDILHRAGRIRSPWLPGMATGDDGCVRILDVEHDGIPGLIRVIDDDLCASWVWPWERPCPQPHCERCDIGDPDLTDPATVGCLAALAREASGERDAYAISASGWTVCFRDLRPLDYHGLTEGDAWKAALVAMGRAA